MEALPKKIRIDFELSELDKAILDQMQISYKIENDVFNFEDDNGADELRLVYKHGANCGITGMIANCDIVEFYLKHMEAIQDYWLNFSDELGEGFLEMIKNFNWLKDSDFSKNDIFKALKMTTKNELFDSDFYEIILPLVWGLAEELAINIFDRGEVLETFEN